MWNRLWDFLDRWLFGPASVGPDPAAVIVRLLRYPYAVLRDLWRGQINLRAMGLVFTTLLALIPLLAFAFAILKVFGAHRELEPIVGEFFRPLGPQSAKELTDRTMEFADSVSGGIVGSLGFALLVWTLLGTIRKVEESFNFLWHVQQPRSFGRRIAEHLSLLVIGPILLVGFIGLSHAALQSAVVRELTEQPFAADLMAHALRLAPYAMVTAVFTVLYMLVPNTRVQLRAALIGAVVAGVLWAAVGTMFTRFVVYSVRLTIVYAGFAVIVAAVLWTYFGWLILLAGARLSFYVQNPGYLRLGLEELRLSAAETEQLAIRVMYLVGRAHVTGEKRWTVGALARDLALPSAAVAEIVTALERAGLLIVTEKGELVPGRDIGRIGVLEILDVARNQRSGHLLPRVSPLPAVDRIFEHLNEAWHERCADRTLRMLIDEDLQTAGASATPQPSRIARQAHPVRRGEGKG
ncbi:MAG: YihY/virulence factor BrkB family protein [Pseudomonadota bacterium]